MYSECNMPRIDADSHRLFEEVPTLGVAKDRGSPVIYPVDFIPLDQDV